MGEKMTYYYVWEYGTRRDNAVKVEALSPSSAAKKFAMEFSLGSRERFTQIGGGKYFVEDQNGRTNEFLVTATYQFNVRNNDHLPSVRS